MADFHQCGCRAKRYSTALIALLCINLTASAATWPPPLLTLSQTRAPLTKQEAISRQTNVDASSNERVGLARYSESPESIDLQLAAWADQPAADIAAATESAGFEGTRLRNGESVGTNFYAPRDDFGEGIVIIGRNAAMKIGGYVKVDLIHDFNAIESEDFFDTTTIPVDAPHHTNSRFHARQSRLNFDTRWGTDWGPVRIFIEGDFFSEGDRYRLRHAYGEVRQLIVGQTWSTLTDMDSLPQTLDFEGAVSSVSRRQGQVRWTQPLIDDRVSLAVAIEDSQIIVDLPEGVEGEPRTESPDFVVRLRLSPDWGQFQVATVLRELGFQPVGGSVARHGAWGFNFTGVIHPSDGDKFYYQVMFGEGVGSYRGLPDAVPLLGGTAEVVGTLGWMVGWTHDWTDNLSSNFTYSESSNSLIPNELPSNLHANTYLAANLIWQPIDRMFVGVEYLFGTRENVNGGHGEANRVQASFGFYLP